MSYCYIIMMEAYEIVEKTEDNRFEAVADGKVVGEVDFHFTHDGKALIVSHTGVRSEYEGKGIAGALNKALLEYVKNNNLRVIPVCPYTKAYIGRHPEYEDLVAKS